MRIKDVYKVREIAGENLVVEQGKQQSDMTKVISLNSSAVLLWNELKGRDFTLDDAAQVLVAQYGIPLEQARKDAEKWTEKLTECGVMA